MAKMKHVAFAKMARFKFINKLRVAMAAVYCLCVVIMINTSAAAAAAANIALLHGGGSHMQQEVASNEQQQQEEEQQELDRIDQLPGQPPAAANLSQFAGYVTVNDAAGRAFFYWLTESPSDSPSKPLVLWLNGGPGCSSIAYGAMEEIGPFHINPDGQTLYVNQYAWTEYANLLFLDAPAGVGYSYTNTSSDLHTTGDTRTSEDSYNFIVRWFERFPQYAHRDFYIMGESYAGHYAPQLAKLLYERQVKGVVNPRINLKGFMVGNAVTDQYYDNIGKVEYWWNSALISDKMRHDILTTCNFHSTTLSNACLTLRGKAWTSMGDIDFYNIYSRPCDHPTFANMQLPIKNVVNMIEIASYDPCTTNYAIAYFNREDVQKALHANLTNIPYKWIPCSQTLFNNWNDSALSMLPIYEELMEAGLRIWLYSGDVDAVVPTSSTRHSIEALKRPTKVYWYPWYLDGQVGGHSQVYDGLTFVTIRDSGHEVPHLQPKRALALIQHYLAGDLMPAKTA